MSDGLIWPDRIPRAPQPSRPLIYQWSGSTYTGGSSSSVNNQTMGTIILRPSAPSPILRVQYNLLENFHAVSDNPPPHSPPCHDHLRPCNRSITRFKPYQIDRPHKHHITYLCRWNNEGSLCGHELQVTPKDILAHLREDHGIVDNKESYRCLWTTAHGCCEENIRFQSFGRHITMHIGIRYKCSVCDTTMSARNDVAVKHCKEYPNCSGAHFMIIPGRDTEVLF
ncbi:hypothetical protein EDB19DRAFT_511554 [Suillus lakei]|nr:hypothetical protein EDB19DRAFT_511554 [Suillus lakei]